jgi:Mg-chelatase subunit ChlD
LSAATASRSSGSVMVKKAWKRRASNKGSCPALRRGFRVGDAAHDEASGHPLVGLLGGERGEGTWATSSRGHQVPVASWKSAAVYSIVVDASSSMATDRRTHWTTGSGWLDSPVRGVRWW